MINANELRIGNYLNIHGSPAPIQIGWFYIIATNGKLPPHEPIPLTPEILEACGFGESGDVEFTGKLTGQKIIHLSDSKIKVETKYFKENFIRLKYLHQLQNLYFTLTGEELIIKELV